MNMQPALDKQDTTSVAANYAFDNVHEYVKGCYRELSALYDAQTIRHFKRTGIERGWSCLEAGGSGGSIAFWLCQGVGNQTRTGNNMQFKIPTGSLDQIYELRRVFRLCM